MLSFLLRYLQHLKEKVPRLFFLILVSSAIALTVALIMQLTTVPQQRVQPVTLSIENPMDGQIITDNVLTVKGKTLPKSTVIIYTEKEVNSVESDEDGQFKSTIHLATGLNKLTVSAFTENNEEKRIALDVVYDNNQAVKGEKTSKDEEQEKPEEPPGQEKKQEQAPQAQEAPKQEQPPGQEKKTEQQTAPQEQAKQQQTTEQRAIIGGVEKVTSDSIVVEDKRLKQEIKAKVDKDTTIVSQDNTRLELRKIKPKDEAAIIPKESLSDDKKMYEKVTIPGDGTITGAARIYVKQSSSSAQTKRHAIQGVITNKIGSLITITHQTKPDRSFTFLIDDQTVVKIRNVQTTTKDLRVGQLVTAVGDLTDKGILLAKLIHIIKNVSLPAPTSTPVVTLTPIPTSTPVPSLPITVTLTPISVDLQTEYVTLITTGIGQYLSFGYRYSSPNTIPLSTTTNVRHTMWYDGQVIYDHEIALQTQFNWIFSDAFDTTYKPIIITSGSHTVKVCIDSLNQIPEPNEANNCKEASFTAVSVPTPTPITTVDLRTDYVIPITTNLGQYLSFGYRYSSPNTISFGGTKTVYHTMWYDDQIIYDHAIDIQAQVDWVFFDAFNTTYKPIVITDGTHKIKVCIDTKNQINEPDESNNCKEALFTTTLAPTPTPVVSVDLQTEYVIPITTTAGQYLSFGYRYSSPNTIPLGTTTNVRHTMWYDDQAIYDHGIAIQTQLNWVFFDVFNTTYKPIVVTQGSHKIKVCIDSLNQIPEPNEVNNCKEASFTAL